MNEWRKFGTCLVHVWPNGETMFPISLHRRFDMAAFRMYDFGPKLHRKRAATIKTTKERQLHGHSGHPLYVTWYGMIARCNNENSKNYANYGGRGIFVCDRWLESIENFISDMGEKPLGTSLDRVDNDGPYSPENCRWATQKQQGNNKRTNRRVERNGVAILTSELAGQAGLGAELVNARLNNGWSVRDAITKPLRKRSVSFSQRGEKWLARILINGKRKGAAFTTKEEGLKWGMALLNGEDNGVDTETQ